MTSRAYDAAHTAGRLPGGLVVSLDFELAWGVLDAPGADGPYKANLLGAREAIPRILDLFADYGVAATWATVGFLFAESREELEAFSPARRPAYANPAFATYGERVGASERADPTRFAPSLIRLIAQTPRQRIGTHTFSHYYCLEAGQTVDDFDADLGAAVAIARARGISVRSIVFPRHQVRVDYLPVLTRHGIVSYRGNEGHFLDRPEPYPGGSLPVRAARRANAYVPLTGHHTVPWSLTRPRDGLVNVPASHFLRPIESRLLGLEPLRIGRLRRAMRAAAQRGALLHVWWHPHNMGVRTDEHLACLRDLLETYQDLNEETGFASFALEDVADHALTLASAPES
ncbi:MAG: polysaccharide deacetylase [Trueperaceae bacterium]|nr:MAG: polysaccharide deacetylase [Trueperaceae bacterium]